MKILICGDSFAADWTVKYPGEGWPNMLAKEHAVTNLAQAGCSEYKIYKQLTSVDLAEYDKIIVAHTSPNRIPVETHPVHHKDTLHKNSDLIYTDIKEHSKNNKTLLPIVEFFEKYFDTESAKFSHNLLCQHIDSLLEHADVIHIANINWDDFYKFPNMLNFEHLFESNRGSMNHYDDEGNIKIYQTILTKLSV